MRTEERTIKVTVYISDDGHECNSYEEAARRDEDYRKRKDGSRRKCPHCGGTGRVNGHWENNFDGGMYGDHQYHDEYVDEKCKHCDGKGYQDAETVWK